MGQDPFGALAPPSRDHSPFAGQERTAMPSTKPSPRPVRPMGRPKPVRPVPKPGSAAEDLATQARQSRTRDWLAAERVREAELTKQGYCF